MTDWWESDPIAAERTPKRDVYIGMDNPNDKWWEQDKPVTWSGDIARSIPTGLERGAAGTIGAPRDMTSLLDETAGRFGVTPDNWNAVKLFAQRSAMGMPVLGWPDQAKDFFPSGKDVNDAIVRGQGFEQYEPQTQGGKVAEYLSEFAPAALAPGGAATRAGRVLTSAGGTYLGGEGAKLATGGDPLAEQWGALIGGAGGAGLRVPGAAAADRLAGRIGFDAKPNVRRAGPSVPRIGAPPPPIEAPIDRRLATRGRMTPEKFDATMKPYEEQGIDPFEFQGYGPRAGVAKLEGLSRDQNLNVGDVAKEAIDPAMDALQSRALDSVAKMVAGDASATDATKAIADLQESIRKAGREFDPILHDEAITPELQKKLEPILDRIDDSTLKDMRVEAKKLAKALGYGDADLNEARMLQILKQQLWHTAESLSGSRENPTPTAARGGILKSVWGELQKALHEGIPGYGDLDARYSNLTERARLAEKLHDKITKKIEGTSPGSIGRNLHDMGELRDAYGADAERFINSQRLISKDARDYNRVAPDVNSVTAGASSEMIGDIFETMKGGPLRWAKQLGDMGMDTVARHHREQLGEQLLTRMTPERRAQFRKQLEEIELQKKAALMAQALAAQSGAQSPRREAGE